MNEWVYVVAVIAVAIGGWWVRSLSVSGAIATVFVGLAVAEGFSWKGLVVLGAFFISSSFWSNFQQRKKLKFLEKIEKGSRRDYIQVLANGSIPAVISLFSIYFSSVPWLDMFIISIAAANADTWASEIGSLSKQSPRLITTWKKVEAGTSGAVTLLGTLAALGGAVFIAVVSSWLWSGIPIVIISIFGFFGNFFDTYLGAVWQTTYRCVVCGIETEKKHHCMRETVRIKGYRFINNDIVNWLSIMCSIIVYFFVTKLQ
jgi:uncharacterized protein (TIGR00297 family)